MPSTRETPADAQNGLQAFLRGDFVKCERSSPSRGTWRRFDGLVGRVCSLNPSDGEVGVSFSWHNDASSTYWFRPSELVHAPEGALSGDPYAREKNK